MRCDINNSDRYCELPYFGERLLYGVQDSRRIALPTVDVETLVPSKVSRCSSSVRSRFASRCSGSQPSRAPPFTRGRPEMGTASTPPVWRHRFSHRFICRHRHGEGLRHLLPW
jgi:hypothetical protein